MVRISRILGIRSAEPVLPVPSVPLIFLSFLPDMVIVDEILPSGDSMQVCSQLHSTFGIPVVLLGEDSSDEVWGTLMEAGADLYLIKPFRYRELAARVNWCDGCR